MLKKNMLPSWQWLDERHIPLLNLENDSPLLVLEEGKFPEDKTSLLCLWVEDNILLPPEEESTLPQLSVREENTPLIPIRSKEYAIIAIEEDMSLVY